MFIVPPHTKKSIACLRLLVLLINIILKWKQIRLCAYNVTFRRVRVINFVVEKP
jgi:hypothetical protein